MQDSYGPTLALVYKTGFQTSKGHLIRSILYPKKDFFQFYKDSNTYILMMSVVALLISINQFFLLYRAYKDNQVSMKDVVLHTLEIFTITIPPELPICLSIGLTYALLRYSASPPASRRHHSRHCAARLDRHSPASRWAAPGHKRRGRP